MHYDNMIEAFICLWGTLAKFATLIWKFTLCQPFWVVDRFHLWNFHFRCFLKYVSLLPKLRLVKQYFYSRCWVACVCWCKWWLILVLWVEIYRTYLKNELYFMCNSFILLSERKKNLKKMKLLKKRWKKKVEKLREKERRQNFVNNCVRHEFPFYFSSFLSIYFSGCVLVLW